MAITPDEALEQIQRAGTQDNFEIEHSHARPQMRARRVTREDVRYGLMYATSCTLQANGRWKVPTTDQDQDAITIILELRDDVLVITVF